MPFTAQPNRQIHYRTAAGTLSGAEVVAALSPLKALAGSSVLTVNAEGGVFQGPWAELVSSQSQIVNAWQIQLQLPRQGNRSQATLTWQTAFGQLNLVLQKLQPNDSREITDAVRRAIPPRDEPATITTDAEQISELAQRLSELQNSLTEGQAASHEIQNLRETLRPRVDEIEQMVRSVHELESKARTSSREAVAHEETAAKAGTRSSNLKNELETLNLEGKRFAEEARELAQRLTAKEAQLDEIGARILTTEKKSLELLDVSTVAALNRAFKVRADAIKSRQGVWLFLIVLVNAALAVLSYLFVSSMATVLDVAATGMTHQVPAGAARIDLPDGPGWMLVAKLLVGLPLIYLDYFLVSTYRQNRDLIERYEFKNAVTLTMATYQDLIQREQTRGIADSLDFVVRTTDRIYEPPLPDPGMGERERRGLLQTIEKLGGSAIRAAARATTKPDFDSGSDSKKEGGSREK